MALDAVSGPPDSLHVLALNSGSSSLKFGLYRVTSSACERRISGAVESIGEAASKFHAEKCGGHVVASETQTVPGQREAMARIAALLNESAMPPADVIGHRIVHGGPALRRHCVIDDVVLRKLDAASAFAPLHVPPALSVIRFAQEHFPDCPQIACFDTAFHATMPDVARTLPIAKVLQAGGIERYGFHGLSCESVVAQFGERTPDRLIVAHLGNGASITAIRAGKSIDTSMGLTPTGGVIMGTRSGDLDPGVLVYLMREKKFDAARIEDLVDHRSGLLGISGIGSDMRRLRDAASANADARLAVDMFCYSVRKQIAAMIAALGWVDHIVFTGGIGEHDAETRAAICDGLSWAGIALDQERNRRCENPISQAHSPCTVLVLATQEEEQIARHSWTLMTQRVQD
ncbi:MAG TPA: acetate/propionate family kinase [Micropepsaceae bacterium]|jgi:acetate kinase|nr:acetate/propionate family kinase [Micropepsaceae bacterium]